jgi:hypothetical protein
MIIDISSLDISPNIGNGVIDSVWLVKKKKSEPMKFSSIHLDFILVFFRN